MGRSASSPRARQFTSHAALSATSATTEVDSGLASGPFGLTGVLPPRSGRLLRIGLLAGLFELTLYNAYQYASWIPRGLAWNDFRLFYAAATIGLRYGWSHIYDPDLQRAAVQAAWPGGRSGAGGLLAAAARSSGGGRRPAPQRHRAEAAAGAPGPTGAPRGRLLARVCGRIRRRRCTDRAFARQPGAARPCLLPDAGGKPVRGRLFPALVADPSRR